MNEQIFVPQHHIADSQPQPEVFRADPVSEFNSKPKRHWPWWIVLLILLWGGVAAAQRAKFEPESSFFSRLGKVLMGEPVEGLASVGPQGPAGPAGEPGPPGANGQNGLNGADGIDGLPGVNGRDGQDGQTGKNGQDGADGEDGGDACINGVCVSRQTGAPGTAESGSLNLTGTGIFATALETLNAEISGDATVGDDLVVTDDINFSAHDCTGFLNGGTLTTNAQGLVSCTDDETGASSTLQGVYDNGNSIATSNNRHILLSLTDNVQDANFLVDILGQNKVEFRDSGSAIATFADGGAITFTATTNGASTFLVRDNLGNPILDADSTNQRVGIATASPQSTLHVNGTLRVETLAAAAANPLCRDAGNVLATCVSSRQFKQEISYLSEEDYQRFLQDIINTDLATFRMKQDGTSGQLRLGLIAEEAPDFLKLVDENGHENIDFYSYQGGFAWAGIKALAMQMTEMKAELNTALHNGDDAQFGSLNVSGGATIEKLMVTKSIRTYDLIVDGHIIGNHDTRGQLTISAGNREISYRFSSAYAEIPSVVATPVGDPGSRFWISDLTTAGFTLTLENAAAEPAKFNFQVQQ